MGEDERGRVLSTYLYFHISGVKCAEECEIFFKPGSSGIVALDPSAFSGKWDTLHDPLMIMMLQVNMDMTDHCTTDFCI